MSRNRRVVEGVMVALALAGCESPRVIEMARPVYGSGTPMPDDVDYIRAVQCGGLLSALASLDVKEPRQLASPSSLYREWAAVRARDGGQDSRMASPDIAASRTDFLVASGSGSNAERRTRLLAEYASDVNKCRSQAEAADFDVVVIGG